MLIRKRSRCCAWIPGCYAMGPGSGKRPKEMKKYPFKQFKTAGSGILLDDCHRVPLSGKKTVNPFPRNSMAKVKAPPTLKHLITGFLCLFAPVIQGSAQSGFSGKPVFSAIDSPTASFLHPVTSEPPLHAPALILPAIAIGYGVLSMHKNLAGKLNLSTRNEILEDHPGFHTTIDNYLQYSPAAGLLALHLAGMPGEHRFLDELVIYGISSLLMIGSMEATKHFTHEQRPDYSDFKSFPSGHTANAFAAAEWLRSEYRDRSPWIGITGYSLATATGVLRVFNNRHWVSDVVAGAAFGFLSTRIGYAVYPWVKNHVLTKKTTAEPLVFPTRLEWDVPMYPNPNDPP